jgi:hypothetical protein
MDSKFGKMVQSTTGSGNETKPTATELSSMLTATFMKGNGSMTRPTDMEPTSTPMELLMLASGMRTNNTEKALKNGQTEQSMKVTTWTERSMEKAS